MRVLEQYRAQYRWRSWHAAYELLPPVSGARILDLGCGPGDQARDLAAMGARVHGIDADAQLIAHANSRQLPGTTFAVGDARDPDTDDTFDGVWASFLPAYFPDLAPVLARWRGLLAAGGWMALTEVAGLLSHAPLGAKHSAILQAYTREAFDAGRYDFEMGARLAGHLAAAGFAVEVERVLPDQELSFSGPAPPDVLQAWSDRLERMRLLQQRAGSDWVSLRHEFLRCLASPAHTSACRVHFCLARLAQ
jgi:SAM-dependent methyltransferase